MKAGATVLEYLACWLYKVQLSGEEALVLGVFLGVLFNFAV